MSSYYFMCPHTTRNKLRIQLKTYSRPPRLSFSLSGMEFLYLDEDTVDVLRKKQMALTQEVTAE